MPARLTRGKFAASQRTGEFAVTAYSISLSVIEKNKTDNDSVKICKTKENGTIRLF
jgi:hypothetical protein